MPHSIPAEAEVPEAAEVKMEEDTPANGDALRHAPAEEDIDMADAASEPVPIAAKMEEEEPADGSSGGEKKEDVKLEDLFADVDSDDEFPSSRPADGTASSSPPGGMTPTSR